LFTRDRRRGRNGRENPPIKTPALNASFFVLVNTKPAAVDNADLVDD
jgi:hypothetical protein